jgi:hypothetical protein
VPPCYCKEMRINIYKGGSCRVLQVIKYELEHTRARISRDLRRCAIATCL